MSIGLLATVAALTPLAGSADASPTASSSVTASSAVSRSVVATRININPLTAQDVQVDSRTISVTVDQTTLLRDRQPVNVSWTGAHPTGGLVADQNSAAAAEQEYPVVIMECRGVDSSSAAPDSRITPKTCWTQTPGERYVSNNDVFPPYRMDRYAAPSDRVGFAGRPSPYPDACQGTSSGYEHWVPFVAADGTVYSGGFNGCAGLPPEAVNFDTQGQPGNTTYAPSDQSGAGTAKFIINTAESNTSLGCSTTTPCSLVVVPIMGISCDPIGAGLPVADQPTVRYRSYFSARCTETGKFAAGQPNPGSVDSESIAVSGRLWWSESNWRNRVSFPLTFAVSSNVCDVVSSGPPSYLYGSQVARQMTLQWIPAFCTDPKLFNLRHVQTSEPQAKNLLRAGNVEAALQAAPPQDPFTRPTVQSPIGVSGFAIAFSVDDAAGHPLPRLRLNARLLAKLLTESYATNPTISGNYPALAGNPLDLGRDPEFRALNPTQTSSLYSTEAASALFTVSSDSDVMWALTSYINADPEARTWLDGAPDPWGMKVNSSYKGLALPVVSWPLLDNYVDPYFAKQIPCLTGESVPWLQLVQAPVSDPSAVTLNMQFGIANSQINCKNPGSQNQKLAAYGRENPGSRFILGVVPLADAARYQMQTADLETHSSVAADTKITDATGRSFVGPSDASLKAALALMTPDVTAGTWPVPYGRMRSQAAGLAAYPGILLLSVDVATSGMSAADAKRYATFMRFAVGAGQTPGFDNGQLPPGYLPLTAANGASALTAYTRSAADAVAAQQGYVPAVDGSSRAPTPTPTGSRAPSPLPSTGAPSHSSTAPGPTTPSGSPSVAASTLPTPKPPSTPVAIVTVGVTTRVAAGALGQALPALLGLSLLTGAAALVTGLWGRS